MASNVHVHHLRALGQVLSGRRDAGAVPRQALSGRVEESVQRQVDQPQARHGSAFRGVARPRAPSSAARARARTGLESQKPSPEPGKSSGTTAQADLGRTDNRRHARTDVQELHSRQAVRVGHCHGTVRVRASSTGSSTTTTKPPPAAIRCPSHGCGCSMEPHGVAPCDGACTFIECMQESA